MSESLESHSFEKPPAEKPEKLERPGPGLQHYETTARGRSAMQGFESKSNGQVNIEAVKNIAPQEYVQPDNPTLSSGASYDLDVAGERAMAAKATHYHDASGGSRISEYRRLRSEITEDLASKNVQDGVRADDFSSSGTNFPGYDVFGSQEVSQVKAYTLKDGKPRWRAYHTAFADIIDPASEKNVAAAQELMNLKESGDPRWNHLSNHLPAQVQDVSSVSQAASGLAETSTLRIPADQVEPVRQDLSQHILADPEKYGIKLDGSPEANRRLVEDLVQKRVLAIDDRFTTANYQSKAAELSHLRDLNLSALNARG